MKSRISSKGQVTIPKGIRSELGLRTGTRLEFRVEGGRLVGMKKLDEDPILRWRGRGCLPGAETVERYLEDLHGAHGAGQFGHS